MSKVKIKVQVREGVIVLHPDSANPIKSGQEVYKTPQILRYIKDGDLIVIDETKKQIRKSK